MIYDDILNKLPPIVCVPRINVSGGKKLKPIKYDLIIFSYRRDIGYHNITCTCSGNIIIKHTLISFYDDELINSINKIRKFLIKENLYERRVI